MPVMNGLDMIKEIKGLNEEQHVILASAHNDTKNLLTAIDLGVEYFLIKPIDNQRLFEILIRISKRIIKEKELETIRQKTLEDSVEKAFDIQLDNIINAIPVPTVIIDKESKILNSNAEFQSLFDLELDSETIEKLDNQELVLEDMFIKKEGFLYKDDIINWKEELLNLGDVENCKVKIGIAGKALIFLIKMKQLEQENRYMVCLNKLLKIKN
jgi:YesN/AraC family two-component response regulator